MTIGKQTRCTQWNISKSISQYHYTFLYLYYTYLNKNYRGRNP